MTDRPITFSAPMIRALLDGRKTQTRRILKPQPYHFCHPNTGKRTWNASGSVGGRICISDRDLLDLHRKPVSGDRLWCREAFFSPLPVDAAGKLQRGPVIYRADDHGRKVAGRWRPHFSMPRWASRLTLTVTDVRVQRVQDISQNDCIAEGIFYASPDVNGRHEFQDIWNSIHGPDAWNSNPWVAAYTFTVERRNIDQ